MRIYCHKTCLLALRLIAACLLIVEAVFANVFDKNASSTDDLEWGVVLFEYYQKDYFSALVEYEYVSNLNNEKSLSKPGKLLQGGMLLSFGVAEESHEIFTSLLDESTDTETRNSAWYYLANILYHKSEVEKAYAALNNISGKIPSHLVTEYYYLSTLIAASGQGVVSSEEELKQLESYNPHYSYVLFNYAIGELEKEKYDSAIRQLERIIKYENLSDELANLSDRSKHGLAQIHLKLGKVEKAWEYLTQIRTTGLYSNRALLTYAWTAIKLEMFEEAIPALKILDGRSISIPEVQEAKVLLAHLFEKSGAVNKALKSNILAVEAFEQGLTQLENSRQIIERRDVPKEFVKNFEKIVGISDWYAIEPTVDYSKLTPFVIDLISSHAFSETLKELSDLYTLQDNLTYWTKQSDQHFLVLQHADKKAFDSKEKEAIKEANNYRDALDNKKTEYKLLSLSLSEKDRQRLNATLQNIEKSLSQVDSRLDTLNDIKSAYTQPTGFKQELESKHEEAKSLLKKTNFYISKLEPVIRNLINSELDKHADRMGYYLAQSRLAKARLYDSTLMTLDKLKIKIKGKGGRLMTIRPELAALALACVLSGCQMNDVSTLADLKEEQVKEEPVDVSNVSYKEVRQEYQELLELFKDEDIKEQIQRRIADVYMVEGGQKQVTQRKPGTYYLEAIKGYHEILEKYPNSPDNADVLYQLARAYELDGMQDKAMDILTRLAERHPNYENIAEVHFRIGDIYFGRQDYNRALTEYEIVASHNNENLITNAFYMLGWSHYKRFSYEACLNAFAEVLNRELSGSKDAGESLGAAKASLIDDTINSMSLALSKSGGASTIENIALLQGKEYLWRVYDNLGDYFLKKERFEDSADTFRHYVQRYNFSLQAPILHGKLIKTYTDGGFALQALEEKEVYVEYYGKDSQYAKVNNGIADDVLPLLKSYFEELAAHYHSRAQKLAKKVNEERSRLAKGASLSSKTEKIHAKSLESFNKATTYYAKFIETFPKDPKVPQVTYLLAEAEFQAGKYRSSAHSYEQVAYNLKEFKGHDEYRSKAGYAAIVSYQKIVEGLVEEDPERKQWQEKAVESMLRFAEVFHKDDKAPKVLTSAAEYLFSLENYQQALEVSQRLISNNPQLDRNLKQAAYGIVAHSFFKLGKYPEAEQNYISQRKLTASNSKEYSEISDQLANTVYKNAQLLEKQEDKLLVVKELLKIKQLSPKSKIRVIAQYSAVTKLIQLEQWSSAIVELKELQRLYPNHELADEFPRKLAFAYEKNKSWKLAAKSYIQLNKNDADPEIQRTALFLAAEMHEKAKDTDTAIRLYRRYARTYEKPFKVRMEARYKLATLYEELDEISKQQFWLRRIIDGDRKGGADRNDRSRWLGAWANIKYGDYFAGEFRKRKLTRSLANSLSKKNEFLRDAIKRYEQASGYGVLEFVTMSSYKISELYRQLAFELRSAPMPRGLSKEEKGTYEGFIEEQALPLEQLSQELHLSNVERAWEGHFDKWIELSFSQMKLLNPTRFDKQEIKVSYGDEIR